jgi:hypothetical protein
VTRILAAVSFVLASAAFAAEPAAVPAFSAEVELRAEGEVVQRWKLASSGERVRVLPVDNADLSTHVVDLAGKRVWSFGGQAKKCAVIASKDPLAEVLGFPAPGSKEEPAGEEKVSGLQARKSKVTTPEGETVFVWRAAELGDLPIRSLRPTDKVEVVYKKVERTAPDPALFELPGDCPK